MADTATPSVPEASELRLDMSRLGARWHFVVTLPDPELDDEVR